MSSLSPDLLFEHFNRVGAHVDKIERKRAPASFGACDQVRVLRTTSPSDFFIAWWSPWPEGDPRAMHVVHVTGVTVDGNTLKLKDIDGASWVFTEAVGDFAQSVRDYHRQKATDPEYYAAVEARMVRSATGLLASF